MLEYDIIVVGAGPAGSTVAKTCAEEGLRAVIIEKKPASGFKLCGGGLPVWVIREFDIDRNIVECDVTWSHLVGKKHSVLKSIKGDVTVDRAKFDRYLANRAVNCGATILTSTTCSGVVKKDGKVSGIVADSPKGVVEMKGKIVVAADGFSSLTARSANLLPRYKRSDVALTLQIEAYTKEAVDESVTYSFFDEEIALCGYGWLIPKKHGYSVGVGCLLSHLQGKLANGLRFLIEKHPLASRILSNTARKSNLRAACIPLAQSPVSCDDGIMVAGDAAGMVDPLAGDGIYYAMKAGQLAGHVAAAAISDEDVSRGRLLEYQNLWDSRYGGVLRQKKKTLERNMDNFIAFSDHMIFLEKHPLLKRMNTFRDKALWHVKKRIGALNV